MLDAPRFCIMLKIMLKIMLFLVLYNQACILFVDLHYNNNNNNLFNHVNVQDHEVLVQITNVH